VPATPSREPISAAVTAAAVLATIWMADSPNPPSPSWSPTAAAAADPSAAADPAVAVVAGAIFWVAGSGVTRRETGERSRTGVRSGAIISEVSRVRCRVPGDDPSGGDPSSGGAGRQHTSAPARHGDVPAGARFGSGARPHTAKRSGQALPTGPHRPQRQQRVVGHDRAMTPTTMPTGPGPPEPAVNDQAAIRAEAREQLRNAAGLWLTGDRTAALGRQMVLSITRTSGRTGSPTWAEALAGVDPALWEPITTVPEGWPPAVWRRDWPPAVWRRELRQRPRPPGTSPPATIRTDQVVLSKPDHRSQRHFPHLHADLEPDWFHGGVRDT